MLERTPLANYEYEARVSAYRDIREVTVEQPNFDQQLVDHLDEREWSDVQIANFLQIVGRSALLSAESVLQVLNYQQQIDENIQAQKDLDEWTSRARLPLSFYQDAEQHRTDVEALTRNHPRNDAGWDNPPGWADDGRYLGNPNDRDIA